MTESKLWDTKVKPILKAHGFVDPLRIECSTVAGYPDAQALRAGVTWYLELKILRGNSTRPTYQPGQLGRLRTLRAAAAPAYVVAWRNGETYILPPLEEYGPEYFTPKYLLDNFLGSV